MVKLWPYKMGSKGCKDLARSLGVLRVFSDRHYKPRNSHTIINWGNSVYPTWWRPNLRMLNHPDAVRKASNKLSTLRSLADAGVGIPCFEIGPYRGDLEYPIYCRKSLTSRGGYGIIIAGDESELVDAPLYTQGVPVEREFRVHVWMGEVIDFTEKKRMTTERIEDENISFYNGVRNHDNGWVFCRHGIELPERVAEEAKRGVDALGLDFGAVDICLDSSDNPIIFEVNTAPGVEGTTLARYVEAIDETYRRSN